MKLGASLFALVAFSVPVVARAADPVPQAEIRQDMRSYYGGERAAAYIIGALSLASAGGGAVLVTRDGDFERGLGWPLLALGGLEAIAAVFYGVQVGAEIRHYEDVLGRDPAAFRREESDHIHGTTSRFVFYRVTELALALGGAGVATYGFVANRDVWKGAGIGVFALALPLLLIDTVNNGRAARYQDRVDAFEPSSRPTDAAFRIAPTPWYTSFGGTF